MPFNEYDYDTADLAGKVSAPRLTLPTIRSSKRRSDADGGSTVPYYPGIDTKKLTIEYTDSALVTQDVTITISGTAYQDLIDDIKALDPTNLEALDMGGFLGIRNTNAGERHYVKIVKQAVAAEEAADLLGFQVHPMPGSISWAGELASSPGHRVQQNPQGTALISKGEDLSGDALNRAFVSVLRSVEKLRADLERDSIQYVDVNVTVQAHEISGSKGFYLNDPDIRLPIIGVDPSTDAGDMEGFITLLDPTTKREVYNGTNKVQALRVHHADATTGLNTGDPFAVWDTPDGGHIYDATIPSKVKHASVAIASITGNVVYCPGAQFQTAIVQKNDPVEISGATNTSPYSHNGAFAIMAVLDEEHLRLRPLADGEDYLALGNPFALNPAGSGFGNLEVFFGGFVPARKMFVTLQNGSGLANGSYIARIACGRPTRSVIAQRPFTHNGDPSAAVTAHVNDATDAHAASAIGGFTSATTWADASTISGATLKATIEDILTDLSATTGNGGSGRIGSPTITATGFIEPRTLTSGNVRAQLLSLLNQFQEHEVSSIPHSSAGWINGLTLGTYVFPNLPLNSGTVYAEYLGELRLYAVAGTSFALAGNKTYYIYLDLSDGVAKITETVADAFAVGTTYPLYVLFTQGFGITWIKDFRRNFCTQYGFNKVSVTVGTSGIADFRTIEAAIAFLELIRIATGGHTSRTWEIVIQGHVAMDHTIGISFPVTIRGAAKDNSGVPLCKIVTTDGSSAAKTVAFNTNSNVSNVTFRDIWFEVPSSVAATNNPVIGTQFGHETGDNWIFDNCVFSGGTNAPFIEVAPNSVTPKAWIIKDCWFKAANRTAAASHIKLTRFEGAQIKGCRLEGQTTDLFQTGIELTGAGVDNVIDNCQFDMGGNHIILSSTVDRTSVSGCRHKNSRAATIRHTSSGEAKIDDTWFTSCMTNSSSAEGVIWSDTGNGRLEVTGCRFYSWATGYAIRGINTGKNSRFVNNIFQATAADRVLAGFGDCLFMGNDIDLSPGAASGSGHNIAVVGSFGNNCRVIGNYLRNCNNDAMAGSGNVFACDNSCVFQGNHFVNCRGNLFFITGNGSIVSGNNSFDYGTSEFDRPVDASTNFLNYVYGNNFGKLTEASQLEIRPLFQLHQNWLAPMYAAWTTIENGAATCTVVINPATDKPGVWLRLRCTNGGTDVAAKYSEGILQGPLAPAIAIAVEFYVDSTGIDGLNDDFYFHAGFCHDEASGGVGSTEDAIKIVKTDAANTWSFQTTGASTTSTDTGVFAGGVQKFRFEIVGSDDPGGAVAILYIDDVVRAIHTTNLPADDLAPFAVALVNTGEATAGNYDVYVSPITIEYRKIGWPL